MSTQAQETRNDGDAGKAKPSSRRGLRKIALKLYDAGFNVIPVDSNKRPLTSWSVERRIEGEKLRELLDKASGIAIVGGSENPWKPVAVLTIIDVDNPYTLENNPYLKSIVESTVSWRSGPRCPNCSSKNVKLEKSSWFKCEKCDAEFPLESAKRGIGALITVDPDVAEKYLKGTVRGKEVELLVNNYAVIPPSNHPCGVRYEWAKPFDWNSPNLGIRALVEGELLSLLEELGVRKVKEAQITEIREEHQNGAKPIVGRLGELSDADILRIKELLREAYKPGNRQYVWLYLSGWSAKAGFSPIAVAKALKML